MNKRAGRKIAGHGPPVLDCNTMSGANVEAIHAQETVMVGHRCEHGNDWLGLALINFSPEGEPFATYISYSPDEARIAAAALARFADEIEGRTTQ